MKITYYILLITSILICSQNLYAQDIMPKLPSAYNMFIAKETYQKKLEQYIKPDYFRDDYKRNLPTISDDMSYFEKYPLEFHFTSTLSYSINANTFNMRDIYASIGQTFHNDYVAVTGFATLSGYFDTHDPLEDYGYINGNIGFYDGGVQAIFFDRILISARGRAVYDINTTTFMLMPHYFDTLSNPAYIDTPSYHLAQNLNGPGIRFGFIGNHFELAYSQGDFKHSIPKSLLLKFNIPNIDFRILYAHENRRQPEGYSLELFDSLVQISSTYRFPFINKKLWLNTIAEYTWRERDAHYIRLEQGIAYYMLNIALREIIQIQNNLAKIEMEYAIYGKFEIGPSELSLGFQGTTTGKYYIAGSLKF